MSTPTDGARHRRSQLHDRLEQRPLVTGTIPDLLEPAARKYGEGTALTDPGGTTVSFRELADRAARLGSSLQAHGVQPGDRVALMLPNSIA